MPLAGLAEVVALMVLEVAATYVLREIADGKIVLLPDDDSVFQKVDAEDFERAFRMAGVGLGFPSGETVDIP